jgi:hypothetical protein
LRPPVRSAMLKPGRSKTSHWRLPCPFSQASADSDGRPIVLTLANDTGETMDQKAAGVTNRDPVAFERLDDDFVFVNGAEPAEGGDVP